MYSLDEKQRLREKIEARKKFLTEVVEFTHFILKKKGRVVKREQNSSNTNIVSRLNDFEGFSFLMDTGQTCMGGNTIEISEEPRPVNVLNVYWQSFGFNPEECVVNCFSEKEGWQHKLKYLIDNKGKILKKEEMRMKLRDDLMRAEIENRGEKEALFEEARRLRVSL